MLPSAQCATNAVWRLAVSQNYETCSNSAKYQKKPPMSHDITVDNLILILLIINTSFPGEQKNALSVLSMQ